MPANPDSKLVAHQRKHKPTGNNSKNFGLAIRRVPIESIHPNLTNVRLHGEKNIQAIKASLGKFTQVEPILVQSSSRIVIGGNGRLEAMKQLGWNECDVVEIDVNDTTATALGIALNRTAELAEWDAPGLGDFLQTLDHANFDMDALGYTADDIGQLMASLDGDRPGQQAEPPPAKELKVAAVIPPAVWLKQAAELRDAFDGMAAQWGMEFSWPD